jgi:hypothetical protein
LPCKDSTFPDYGQMRQKIPELELALEGRVEDHHRFLLRVQLHRLQAVEKYLSPGLDQPEHYPGQVSTECSQADGFAGESTPNQSIR